MISVVRWLLVVLYRRFRWVVIGAALRSLTRRTREKSVDEATEELARRLPDPVVKAMEAAPGDLLRFGGSAVAAGRTARTVGDGSRRLGATTRRLRRRWSHPMDSTRAIRAGWRQEADWAQRELWAEYHRAQGDHAAADEALIDRRRVPNETPLPEIPEPVAAGRPHVRRTAKTVVNRMQRTYRRTPRPWDHEGYEPPE